MKGVDHCSSSAHSDSSGLTEPGLRSYITLCTAVVILTITAVIMEIYSMIYERKTS